MSQILFQQESDSHFGASVEVGQKLNALATELGFGMKDVMEIELAGVEAFNNAVEHAYGQEAGHSIWVRAEQEDNALVIRVSTTGKPLEPSVLAAAPDEPLEPDPDDLDSLTSRGRGLSLIKYAMNQVQVETDAQGRNTLIMRKDLP